MLVELINKKVDILCITETELDETFTGDEFILNNFKKPYCLDKSRDSGGLLVFVSSEIPSRPLTEYKIPENLQAIPFEINLKNKKWLIVSLYNPTKLSGKSFLENLSDMIDFYLQKYDYYILIGDMNIQPNEYPMKQFLGEYNLINLVSRYDLF